MSSWGATEIGGEAISAWEFRELFLTYGERYSDFFCPFCDIPLVAMLVYIDADDDLSRSPHFAAREVRHQFDCDGNPLEVDSPNREPPRAHYKPRKMGIPEALSLRPPPRIHSTNIGVTKPVLSPTYIEINIRRKKAYSLGSPIPKTYLVRSIVEARDIEMKKIYDEARTQNWTSDKTNSEIRKAMISMPLHLEDRTNYQDGFRRPTFPNECFKRIYFGTGVASHNGLVITSRQEGKLRGEIAPFEIHIDPSFVANDSPRSHLALMDKLATFALSNEEFRWYAYGLPQFYFDKIMFIMMNLDYLHIKKQYKSRPK